MLDSRPADLAACPFCGGPCHVRRCTSRINYWISCRRCYAETGAYGTPDEAIEAWNRVSAAVTRHE